MLEPGLRLHYTIASDPQGSPKGRCQHHCFTYKAAGAGALEQVVLGPPVGGKEDWNSNLDPSSSKRQVSSSHAPAAVLENRSK